MTCEVISGVSIGGAAAQTLHIRSWLSVTEQITEHQFFNARGTILIREPDDEHPCWLATWLPHDPTDESYPGWTMSSTTTGFPTTSGPLGIAEGIGEQPWAREKEPPPSEAVLLEIPPAEWDETKLRLADAGYELDIWCEPDGRYTYRVSSAAVEIRAGTVDTWADAKLEALRDLPPPAQSP